MDRTVHYYINHIVEKNLIRTSLQLDGYLIYANQNIASIRIPNCTKVLVIDFVRKLKGGYEIQQVQLDNVNVNSNIPVYDIFEGNFKKVF